MDIVDFLYFIKESDEEDGTDGKKQKAFKGRIRTYSTIKDALNNGKYGDIFTTKGAQRKYVISKGKWGAKSGRGKIAKGFTPGSATPSADFSSVRKHAARTKIRYDKGSDALVKKYGSRNQKKKRGIKYS